MLFRCCCNGQQTSGVKKQRETGNAERTAAGFASRRCNGTNNRLQSDTRVSAAQTVLLAGTTENHACRAARVRSQMNIHIK